MKKVVYKIKYYWHSLQYKKNRVLFEDCLSEEMRSEIKSKMRYHERSAINYIARR